MDDNLIRLDEVRKMLGNVSRSSLYEWQRRNNFPPGIHLGERTVAWRREAIRKWISDREKQTA